MNPYEDRITYFAETDYRNKNKRFGIKAKDRTRHVYVIGKTGMGKSTLLENMAVQDIQQGNGFAFIDPHGKTADLLLDYVEENRMDDVLYFAPFDLDYPVSFNVMEDVGPDKRHLVASGLMSAFKKIWKDMWSARMEYILNNILLALLEYPDATILGVNRMLADKTYRKKVVANITDVSVKSFWEDEFAKYGDRYMQEAGAAIQNKIGQFISNPLIRNIVGQPHSTFDIREIMDNKKILIINLSKGKVGEDNANLVGSMLITKLYLAAMSRADVSVQQMQDLPNFYLYVDEFQSFANESFADILSEARKYKLNLTIAHQYVEQMSEEVRAAVFGNVGTMIAFRVGSYDADLFEKEFAPEFIAEDLVNLGFAQIYLKLMIDGIGSRPFSARTLGPIPEPTISIKDRIMEHSRMKFAKPKDEVADIILRWHESHAGLLDDPQVDAMRRKKAEAEARGEVFDPNNPGGKNNESKSVGAKESGGESRTSNSSNSRKRDSFKNNKPSSDGNRNKKQSSADDELQKVLSLRHLEQRQDKEREQKKKQENQKQNKKSGSNESIKDLRSTLADVIKDAQKGVEAQMKQMGDEVRRVREGDTHVGKIVKQLNSQQGAIRREEKVVQEGRSKTFTQARSTRPGIQEIPKPDLEAMLDAGPLPASKR